MICTKNNAERTSHNAKKGKKTPPDRKYAGRRDLCV